MKTFEELCNLSDHNQNLNYFYDKALDRARELPEHMPFVEVGTRAGGTALLLLHAIVKSGKPRPLFTIDPYGNKPFKRNKDIVLMDYDEHFYKTAIKEIAKFMLEDTKKICTHYHWKITSTDFFKIYDQVDIWYKGRVLKEKMGFVYLDGDHEENVVAEELEWFLGNIDGEGIIVVDDTENIESSQIEVVKRFVYKSLLYGRNRRYLKVKNY